MIMYAVGVRKKDIEVDFSIITIPCEDKFDVARQLMGLIRDGGFQCEYAMIPFDRKEPENINAGHRQNMYYSWAKK